MSRRILLIVAALSIALPSGALAQDAEQRPLSEMLGDLYVDVAFKNASAFASVFGLPPHVVFDDFVSGRQFDVTAALNKQIAAQVTSFPLGSSAAGFTWTFVPDSGTFQRSSDSFGPTFVERALTVGRNRFNLGVNFQRASFDQIEGRNLGDNEIRVYTGVRSVGVFFEDSLNLKLTTDTVGIFANYGVTDHFDLGVAVPIVHVKMDATLTTRVGSSSGGVPATAQSFLTERSGSSSGIGNIIGRAKYNFLQKPLGGLAAGVDFRFPTGNELELTGLAGYQSKFYVAASGSRTRITPHANFGYTFSGESAAASSGETFVFAPPDEWNFAGGVDIAATPRLTVVGDLVGRTLRNSFRLEPTASEFGPAFTEFSLNEYNLRQTMGTLGFKFNPRSTALVSASVLFPINHQGLTDNLTYIVGIDWAF